MSVLSLEPCVWPEKLFLEDNLGNVKDDDRWFVLHTRPRMEKSIARQLLAQDISFFLPLHESRQRYQRRSVVSHLPLFPGYVFLNGDEQERVDALRSNRVANCLTVSDDQQKRLWEDLKSLHICMQSGLSLFPEQRLCQGTLVEIKSGPLSGVRGTVIRRLNSKRVIVAVDYFQRGASVEVNDFTVEPI